MWPFRRQKSQSSSFPYRQEGFHGVEVRLDELIALRHQTGSLGVGSKKRVHSLLAGGERSPFKGRGIDFEESRRYQPGDDVRLMDWRVMARTHEPYLKVFREERERPVFMVVDDRRAMQFGTKVAFKSVVAAEATALLGWASYERGDRVGAVVFSDDDHVELRPRGGRTGVLKLLHLLSKGQSTTASIQRTKQLATVSSPLILAMNRVLKTARPGSLIFLLSDFHEWNQLAKNTLIRLGSHHEVVAIFIYDPLEQEAPPPGHYPVTDGQNMGSFNTTSSQIVKSYMEQFRGRYEDVRSGCLSGGIGFIPLGTHEDCSFQLRRGFSELGHRRSASQLGMTEVS